MKKSELTLMQKNRLSYIRAKLGGETPEHLELLKQLNLQARHIVTYMWNIQQGHIQTKTKVRIIL